jgi:hypothetical protein
VYKIREVDASYDDVSEEIAFLHRMTSSFPPIDQEDFDNGFWWIGYFEAKPVSFAGIVPSTIFRNGVYFKRVGVLHEHRGRRLQLRHMQTMERKARASGYGMIVSDTTNNLQSANNFIRAGYELFEPGYPWAFEHSLYWKKAL